MEKNKVVEFLRRKKLLADDNERFTIVGDFGKVTLNNLLTQFLDEAIRDLTTEDGKLCGSVDWIDTKTQLPPRPDEDYLITVRNKNKDGGIPIISTAHYCIQRGWVKTSPWEDVVYWAELPRAPF